MAVNTKNYLNLIRNIFNWYKKGLHDGEWNILSLSCCFSLPFQTNISLFSVLFFSFVNRRSCQNVKREMRVVQLLVSLQPLKFSKRFGRFMLKQLNRNLWNVSSSSLIYSLPLSSRHCKSFNDAKMANS